MDYTRTVFILAVVCFGTVFGKEFDELCRGNKTVVAVNGTFCEKFVICHNGEAGDDQYCPAGTLFSEEKGECDHKYNVNCKDDTPSQSPSRPLFMFQNFNSDCFYGPWPGNCSFFSICVRAKRFDFHCNVDLVMDPMINMCNYPRFLEDSAKQYCGIPAEPDLRNPFLQLKVPK